jgi:hypothetical protein
MGADMLADLRAGSWTLCCAREAVSWGSCIAVIYIHLYIPLTAAAEEEEAWKVR